MTKDIKIWMNNNADMSKGKYAAHAVHAALNAAGIEHGAVLVLGGPKKLVSSLNTVIHDAGRTELEPGTLTAGTDWEPDTLSEDQKLSIKAIAEDIIRMSEEVPARSASLRQLGRQLHRIVN